MKIVADSHIPFVEDYFADCAELVLKKGRSIVAKDVKDADILLVRSVTHVNEALLKDSSVKFVGSVTAGSDHLDTKWLDQAGISWSVATGFNAPPVADYVVSVIAALQRKNILPKKNVRAAIIGVGNVGCLVQEKLSLLNFDLILCDPYRAQMENDFPHTQLEAIENVDFISLHVPLAKSGLFPTYHFLDSDFFQRQKKGSVLLNASRGAVIANETLLKSGQHLNWCLDVWENEPHINLTVLERAVIATPHIAGYSVQSKMRGIDMIYKIASDKKLLPNVSAKPKVSLQQELAFAGNNHHWQDIVLGVFNPLIITAMMRTLILASDDAHVFDEMRNQFNYRHEFSSTKLKNLSINQAEKILLMKLGLQCEDEAL